MAAEPAAARRLVEMVDALPLALRVLGSRLAARPHWSLGFLVSRMADPRRCLDEQVQGEVSVRAQLRAGFDLLAEPERSLLRLWVVPASIGRRRHWQRCCWGSTKQRRPMLWSAWPKSTYSTPPGPARRVPGTGFRGWFSPWAGSIFVPGRRGVGIDPVVGRRGLLLANPGPSP